MTWPEDSEKFKERPYVRWTVRLPFGQVLLAVWTRHSDKRRAQGLPPLTEEEWLRMGSKALEEHAEEALSHYLEWALETLDMDIQDGMFSPSRAAARDVEG